MHKLRGVVLFSTTKSVHSRRTQMSVTINSNKKLHPRNKKALETILKHHGFDKDDISFMSFGVVECGGTTIVNTNGYKSRSIAKDIKHCGLTKQLSVSFK